MITAGPPLGQALRLPREGTRPYLSMGWLGLGVDYSADIGRQRGLSLGYLGGFSGFVVRSALRRFALARRRLKGNGRLGSDRTYFHGWTPCLKM